MAGGEQTSCSWILYLQAFEMQLKSSVLLSRLLWLAAVTLPPRCSISGADRTLAHQASRVVYGHLGVRVTRATPISKPGSVNGTTAYPVTEPASSSSAPSAPSNKPASSSSAPSAPSNKPASSSSAPSAPSNKPAISSSAPNAPSNKPASSSSAPNAPSNKPASSSSAPSAPSNKPASSDSAPSAPSNKPASSSSALSAPSNKPASSSSAPSAPSNKPASSSSAPSGPSNKPASSDSAPSAPSNNQPHDQQKTSRMSKLHTALIIAVPIVVVTGVLVFTVILVKILVHKKKKKGFSLSYYKPADDLSIRIDYGSHAHFSPIEYQYHIPESENTETTRVHKYKTSYHGKHSYRGTTRAQIASLAKTQFKLTRETDQDKALIATSAKTPKQHPTVADRVLSNEETQNDRDWSDKGRRGGDTDWRGSDTIRWGGDRGGQRASQLDVTVAPVSGIRPPASGLRFPAP